jgi:hypothetical protein
MVIPRWWTTLSVKLSMQVHEQRRLRMAKQVKIIIGPTGDSNVEAIGTRGPECKALTKPFEDALGNVTDDSRKPEYHQLAERSNPQEQW